jgi:hypothetical protein
MSRTLRPLAAFALVALISVIGAGCGSNAPSETGTASSSSSGSAGTANSTREKAVKFAECMRDNGVPQFPDPDASGELTIDGVVNGSSLDPNSAVFRNAISACKDLEPAGFTGHKRSDQEQEGALKFAQCVRENGVKDFPDPVKGAPLVDTNRIPSSATSGGMTILNAAMHTCSALAAKAGVSR